MKTKTTVFSDLDNLLLNMSSGLLPEHLRKDEINLLEKKYGKNWFAKLGYTEPDYKKPVEQWFLFFYMKTTKTYPPINSIFHVVDHEGSLVSTFRAKDKQEADEILKIHYPNHPWFKTEEVD